MRHTNSSYLKFFFGFLLCKCSSWVYQSTNFTARSWHRDLLVIDWHRGIQRWKAVAATIRPRIRLWPRHRTRCSDSRWIRNDTCKSLLTIFFVANAVVESIHKLHCLKLTWKFLVTDWLRGIQRWKAVAEAVRHRIRLWPRYRSRYAGSRWIRDESFLPTIWL